MLRKIAKITLSFCIVFCVAISVISVNAYAQKATSNVKQTVTADKSNANKINIKNETPKPVKKAKKVGFDVTDFAFPLSGDTVSVTSPYGWRTIYGSYGFHAGIDLDAVTGERVNSFKSGKVHKVMTAGSASWGNFVIIYHGKYNGKKFYTGYAHLNSISVKKGEKVKQGEKIGTAGNTGRSYGSHLHFEVYVGGTSAKKPTSKSSYFQPDRVNPAAYIGLKNEKGEQKVTNESLVKEKETTPHIKMNAVSNSKIQVKWAAASSRKHKLQQKVDNGKWKTVTTTTNKVFNASALKIGKKYSYRVKTYYKDNHVGCSDTVSFAPLDKIKDVEATLTDSTTVKLKWSNVESAEKYLVYRKIGNGKWIKKAEVKNNSFSNSNLTPDTTIKYKVKAIHDGAKGDSSTPLEIHTLSCAEISSADTSLGVVTLNLGFVKSALGYNIYRKAENESEFVKIGTTDGLQFTDTTATAGKRYIYAVTAFDSYYETKKSNEYLIIA